MGGMRTVRIVVLPANLRGAREMKCLNVPCVGEPVSYEDVLYKVTHVMHNRVRLNSVEIVIDTNYPVLENAMENSERLRNYLQTPSLK